MNDSIIQIALDMQQTNGMVSVMMKRGDTARKIIIYLLTADFRMKSRQGAMRHLWRESQTAVHCTTTVKSAETTSCMTCQSRPPQQRAGCYAKSGCMARTMPL